MRQIGNLPDRQQAQSFADYLLTLGINGSVEEDTEGWAVWIHDEDQLEQARLELAAFHLQPEDERYQTAATEAAQIKKKAQEKAEQARRKTVDVRRQWTRPLMSQCYVTYGMIAISVIVALATDLGEQREPVLNLLSIASYKIEGGMMYWTGLREILHGQIWRVVTPIFIHFGFLHILFNMLWLRDLGAAIEVRRGSLRLVLIILTIAISSNLCQYGVSRAMGSGGPNFGGMSGVVFGLFGYIWMRSRYDPASGFFMHANTVFLMIAWFFLCMTGMVGSIANTAHGVGLAVGMLLGYAPTLWRRFR